MHVEMTVLIFWRNGFHAFALDIVIFKHKSSELEVFEANFELQIRRCVGIFCHKPCAVMSSAMLPEKLFAKEIAVTCHILWPDND
jgi:hypothetical protein